jgi:hypothetical protein
MLIQPDGKLVVLTGVPGGGLLTVVQFDMAIAAAERRVGGPVRVEPGNGGYSGSGYADFANPAGDTVTWTVNSPGYNDVYLAIRYANGAASDRPLQLSVNGSVEESALSSRRPARGPRGDR